MPVASKICEKKYPIQFSIFTENKIGHFNIILKNFTQNDIHIFGFNILDHSDCAILKLVPNYPEQAETLLSAAGFNFSKNPVLAVAVTNIDELSKITQILFQKQINIRYLYPLLDMVNNKKIIILSTDDLENAETILSEFNFEILTLSDLAR